LPALVVDSQQLVDILLNCHIHPASQELDAASVGTLVWPTVDNWLLACSVLEDSSLGTNNINHLYNTHLSLCLPQETIA